MKPKCVCKPASQKMHRKHKKAVFHMYDAADNMKLVAKNVARGDLHETWETYKTNNKNEQLL